jgi:hypothetical protein
VYGSVEKYACINLTGVSLLMRLTTGDFTVGQGGFKAASSKVVKHERACSENQHVFILFAFDIFDFLAPKTVNILKIVQRVMHSMWCLLNLKILYLKGLSLPIKKS